MNYTELTDAIQKTVENTFPADMLALFVRNAEEKIYNAADFPVLRRNVTSELTAGNQYLTLPNDFLYAYSLAVYPTGGDFDYLLNVDVNFIREAYPSTLTVGKPKHYAQFDEDTLILGPTPDAYYQCELHYARYPESIVTATTSWLGTNYPSVLLNGALTEAARYLKEEPDVIGNYDKMFQESLMLLGEYGVGKSRRDAYRSGQRTRRVDRG